MINHSFIKNHFLKRRPFRDPYHSDSLARGTDLVSQPLKTASLMDGSTGPAPRRPGEFHWDEKTPLTSAPPRHLFKSWIRSICICFPQNVVSLLLFVFQVHSEAACNVFGPIFCPYADDSVMFEGNSIHVAPLSVLSSMEGPLRLGGVGVVCAVALVSK